MGKIYFFLNPKNGYCKKILGFEKKHQIFYERNVDLKNVLKHAQKNPP
jgi:hypothetical protein